jgi:plasmid stability protein
VRNLTVSVDEDVARWARVWAAEHDTSVSRLVGEILRQRMLEEREYETAMQRYLSLAPAPLSGGKRYPRREELHDRRRLR